MQNSKRFRPNPATDRFSLHGMLGDTSSPHIRPGCDSDSYKMPSVADKTDVTRADVLALIRRKDEMEAEIKVLHEVLDGQGTVGMDGPLLDPEGFPRSDIDVYMVRTARHKIICLNNDHKALMEQIEKGLYAIHAQAREEYMETEPAQSNENRTDKPFAKIQFVTQESPAAKAGLQSGDLILAFGSATSATFRSLADLASIVQNSENRALNVEVLRGGAIRHLTLIPARWSGRGLLGCSFLEERQL